MTLSYEPQEAIRDLTRTDPRLGAVVEQIGPFGLELFPYRNAFEALTRSIIYQQLAGHAAQAIHARLLGTFPRRRHPGPAQILGLSNEQLRAIGLSKAKTIAIRDLASRAHEGEVPSNRELSRMSDESIIETLCVVKGIGPWTVQMLLIFYLGRPDVLPATDLGIRKGFQYTYRKRDLPTPKAILAFGRRWRPYRSVASWYLWRASYLSPSIRNVQ